MDIGDNDIIGKCKSHWIYKYVYHACVFKFYRSAILMQTVGRIRGPDYG